MPVGGPSSYIATKYPDQDIVGKRLMFRIMIRDGLFWIIRERVNHMMLGIILQSFIWRWQESLLKFAEWIDQFAPADPTTATKMALLTDESVLRNFFLWFALA